MEVCNIKIKCEYYIDLVAFEELCRGVPTPPKTRYWILLPLHPLQDVTLPLLVNPCALQCIYL